MTKIHTLKPALAPSLLSQSQSHGITDWRKRKVWDTGKEDRKSLDGSRLEKSQYQTNSKLNPGRTNQIKSNQTQTQREITLHVP
jgi:hypothetical protein